MEVGNIAKFTGKPKAKVPWGLLIKSHLEYLSSDSIPEGFVMKDPSKWTKADMWMLWNHWNSQEEEDKVIVSFIKCKKEDEPLGRPWNRKTPSKKREWMSPGEDSEAGVEAKPSDLGEEIGGAGMTPIATSSGAQDILDSGRAPSEDTPHESSPACHANGDRVKYLKSLCIMPRYQELVELVDGLPETVSDKLSSNTRLTNILYRNLMLDQSTCLSGHLGPGVPSICPRRCMAMGIPSGRHCINCKVKSLHPPRKVLPLYWDLVCCGGSAKEHRT